MGHNTARTATQLIILGMLATLGAAAQAPAPDAVTLHPVVAGRQLAIDRGAAAVWQNLKKLDTRASLMMIVAHPDDEDGAMLTYESRGQGVRTSLLTLNRGEGGENLMSDDFDDALGLVRTEELLAAGQRYGVQQYFTRVVDFGFSKTQAETMAKWGHERLLADVVRAVRMARPLVLTSVFVGGPSDGHGNHAAAGEVSQEVYTAACDPKVFPDQIAQGLQPWCPLRVFARVPLYAFTPKGIYDYANQVYTPGRIYDYVNKKWINGPPSVTVEVHDGGYNPLLGATYPQIAREGLAQQRSQHGAVPVADPGANSTPYHLYGSRVPAAAHESSYFSGIDVSLAGIADLAPASARGRLRSRLQAIEQVVNQAMLQFRAPDPAAIAPLLAQGLAQTNSLLQFVAGDRLPAAARYNIEHELQVKRAQFNDAILQALGISLSARVGRVRGAGRFGPGGPSASYPAVIPGQRFLVAAYLDNPSADAVEVQNIGLESADGKNWNAGANAMATGAKAVANNQPDAVQLEAQVPADAGYTRPYFSRPNHEQPYYNLQNTKDADLATAPYPLAVVARLRYRGVTVETSQVVQTLSEDHGHAYENPLVVAPAVSVAMTPQVGILPLPAKAFSLQVTLHGNAAGQGTLRLRLPPGWTATPASAGFAFTHAGEDRPEDFKIEPGAATEQAYSITAVASFGGRNYEEGYHSAGYAGLRPYNLYMPAVYHTRGVRVKVAPGLAVGYLPGTGDSVPEALTNLGIRVHTISPGALASGDLRQYSAIVLGIRAYTRADLRADNARLLEYVKNGGVLIVQYGTAEFNHDYGPYPYTMAGAGATVVNEDSAVKFLAPDNPALRWPNKIGPADFQGWFEERGHGFLASWDKHYVPLVSMHDADQPPQAGGLLYAPYGKGVYVYEGLAIYRQLAEGIPGGFRIFANLLSLAKNPLR